MKKLNSFGLMNFVPLKVTLDQKKLKQKKLIRKTLMIALGAIIVAIGAEAAFIAYSYTNAEHQESIALQEKYGQAQNKTAQIQKTQAILSKAEEEHQPLIKIIDTLAAIKPAELKITKIEIAETGDIQVEGYVNNPALCNIYVEQINNEKELFANAHLERLSANSAVEHKTFLIRTAIK